MSEKKKNLWYWAKTLGEGVLWTGGYYATDLLKLFPDNTLADQIAIPAGFLIGFLFRRWLASKDHYEKDQLPSGMTKLFDQIPNRITGVKGSKK